jgi:DNA topoisomerase-2
MNYLKNKLLGQSQLNENFDFMPYYEGFSGTISKLTPNKILFKGLYNKTKNDEIIVTELPISLSTQKFKELIDKLQNERDEEGKKITPIIKEYNDNSTESKIHFTITFSTGKLKELEETTVENGCNGVEKVLKLFTTETTSNMNLFNSEDKLVKYNTISEIIDDYYLTRHSHYQLRKDYLINKLEQELKILRNKSRYIQEILNDTIDLRRKTEEQVNQMLSSRRYETVGDNYNYLTDMKMSSVCNENVIQLNNKYAEKEEELENLMNTTIENMWLNELQILEVEYARHIQERKEKDREQSDTRENSQKKEKVNRKKSANVKEVKEVKQKNKEEEKEEDVEINFTRKKNTNKQISNKKNNDKIPDKKISNKNMEMEEEEYIDDSDTD